MILRMLDRIDQCATAEDLIKILNRVARDVENDNINAKTAIKYFTAITSRTITLASREGGLR